VRTSRSPSAPVLFRRRSRQTGVEGRPAQPELDPSAIRIVVVNCGIRRFMEAKQAVLIRDAGHAMRPLDQPRRHLLLLQRRCR
jgi:hypothetical protein